MDDNTVFYTLFDGTNYWRSGNGCTGGVMEATWFRRREDAVAAARSHTGLLIVKCVVTSEQLDLGDS